MTRVPGFRSNRVPTDYYANAADLFTASDSTSFRNRFQRHDAHPGESLFRMPPIRLEDHLHDAFVRELRKESPPTFVLEYHGGRCWGQAGSVVTPNNKVLAEMSYEFAPTIQQYQIFQQHILDRPRHLPGTAILLAAPAGNVYAHFLLDILPKLAILERAGFDWRSADHYIISGPHRTFQAEALSLLGIESHQVRDMSAYPHWSADRMLIPSRPGISGNYPGWAVDFVRQLLLPLAQVPSGWNAAKVFISRRMAGKRRIINESELFESLRPLGFQTIENENFTFREQIGLYAAAEFVIGPMGSSTTNTLFCRPDTPVIETYSDSSVNVFTWSYGQFVPLRFAYLIGSGIVNGEHNPHEWDYRIDPAKMRAVLERLVA